MSVLFVLIVASVSVAGLFLALYIWAARAGQFEDMQTPAMRMLTDADRVTAKPEEKRKKQ